MKSKRFLLLLTLLALSFSSCSLFGMYILDINNESSFTVECQEDRGGKIITLYPGESYHWKTTRIGGNIIIVTCVNGYGRGEANTVEDTCVTIRDNGPNGVSIITTR